MKSVATQTVSARGCGTSVGQTHAGQELDPGALDQRALTDGRRASGGVVVEVPVGPGPVLVLVLVIDELEQVFRHAHLARPAYFLVAASPFGPGCAQRHAVEFGADVGYFSRHHHAPGAVDPECRVRFANDAQGVAVSGLG